MFCFHHRSLHQVIQDLRRHYNGAVPLATQERMSLSLRRLGEERRDAIDRLRRAENVAHEALTARDEMELQVQSLQELKATLESADNQKQLVEWFNKNSELRLKVSTSVLRVHATEFKNNTKKFLNMIPHINSLGFIFCYVCQKLSELVAFTNRMSIWQQMLPVCHCSCYSYYWQHCSCYKREERLGLQLLGWYLVHVDYKVCVFDINIITIWHLTTFFL
jgi:hypothetical protein